MRSDLPNVFATEIFLTDTLLCFLLSPLKALLQMMTKPLSYPPKEAVKDNSHLFRGLF